VITLHRVSKTYQTRQGPRQILKDISLTIARGERVGIVGGNGAGKSTLIRLVGGVEVPTSGYVERGMTVSWPLAFSGGFQGSLTGVDNLRFICRIYDADVDRAIPLVEDFAELGTYLREPVKNYSSGMRARLAFAISMAIEFDCYLIDETLSVGDERFKKKAGIELFEKRGDRAMLMVSHMPQHIKKYCTTFCVLHGGRIERFDHADDAYKYYTGTL
jgi:capsular polysaccharide transport system ATP-binding protein